MEAETSGSIITTMQILMKKFKFLALGTCIASGCKPIDWLCQWFVHGLGSMEGIGTRNGPFEVA